MKAFREWLAYSKERFSPIVFLPLGALLVLPSFFVGSPEAEWRRLVFQFFWILWTLFFLRLWDDLASLEEDRLRHPFRVLVRSNHLFFFQSLCALGLSLSLFSVLASLHLYQVAPGSMPHTFWQTGLVGAIFLGLGVLYFSQGAFTGEWKQIGFVHLLLLKYPVLAAVFAGPHLKTLVLSGLVYFLVNVYEFAHDSRHRASRPYRVVALVESGIFAVLFVYFLKIQIG